MLVATIVSMLQLNHTGLEFLVYFRISYDTLWAVFLLGSITSGNRAYFSLQDLSKRFKFVLDQNLGHFEANLFHHAKNCNAGHVVIGVYKMPLEDGETRPNYM